MGMSFNDSATAIFASSSSTISRQTEAGFTADGDAADVLTPVSTSLTIFSETLTLVSADLTFVGGIVEAAVEATAAVEDDDSLASFNISGSSVKGDVADICDETEPLCLGLEDSLEPLRLPRDFLTWANRPGPPPAAATAPEDPRGADGIASVPAPEFERDVSNAAPTGKETTAGCGGSAGVISRLGSRLLGPFKASTKEMLVYPGGTPS